MVFLSKKLYILRCIKKVLICVAVPMPRHGLTSYMEDEDENDASRDTDVPENN